MADPPELIRPGGKQNPRSVPSPPPAPYSGPWLFAGGLVFFLVVEAEKLVLRSSPRQRSAVTSVEAGTAVTGL